MSLLMFVHTEQGFKIMTDTYATTVDGEPFSFVDKCFPFPSRDMVVASTGLANLVTRWVDFLRNEMVALDLTQIDAHAPRVLNEIWESLTADHDGYAGSATIYHFGFDFHTREAIRHTYRSRDGFVSEKTTEPGFGIKPEPDGKFEIPDDDEDWLALAERVRAEQDALPPAERIYIGGDLMTTVLLPQAVGTQRSMRFDDFEDHWNRANERLQREN